jgi:hypothetical protein
MKMPLLNALHKGKTAGMYEGQFKNCYITILAGEDIELRVYAPCVSDKDNIEVYKLIAAFDVKSRKWIRGGLQMIFTKKAYNQGALYAAAEAVTAYFERQYPQRKLKDFKKYECGALTTIEVFFTDCEVILHYCEELRRDFTKNYVCTTVDSISKRYTEISISTYEHGTLELKHGALEMHRWEDEEEASAASYLNKRYTARFLDGIVTAPDAKLSILNAIAESIASKTIDDDDRALLKNALDFLAGMP